MKKHARRDLIRAVPRSSYESANSASFSSVPLFKFYLCSRYSRELARSVLVFEIENEDTRDESRIFSPVFSFSLRKRISKKEFQFYFIISSLTKHFTFRFENRDFDKIMKHTFKTN